MGKNEESLYQNGLIVRSTLAGRRRSVCCVVQRMTSLKDTANKLVNVVIAFADPFIRENHECMDTIRTFPHTVPHLEQHDILPHSCLFAGQWTHRSRTDCDWWLHLQYLTVSSIYIIWQKISFITRVLERMIRSSMQVKISPYHLLPCLKTSVRAILMQPPFHHRGNACPFSQSIKRHQIYQVSSSFSHFSLVFLLCESWTAKAKLSQHFLPAASKSYRCS